MTVIFIRPPSFGANGYLLISGTHALAVDPAPQAEEFLSAAKQQGVTIEGILLTHGHFDHITSVDALRDATACPLMLHEADAPMLTDGKKNAYTLFYGTPYVRRPAERLLTDGEEIPLGDETVRVLHTPGHSPGSVCFLCGDTLLTGDTLFSDSIGRCDLWGGSERHIRSSLQQLRTLQKDLRILPGHGAPSTLGAALDNAAYYL